MREPETGKSKGYGFVSYDNFDSSDTALSKIPKSHLLLKGLITYINGCFLITLKNWLS